MSINIQARTADSLHAPKEQTYCHTLLLSISFFHLCRLCVFHLLLGHDFWHGTFSCPSYRISGGSKMAPAHQQFLRRTKLPPHRHVTQVIPQCALIGANVVRVRADVVATKLVIILSSHFFLLSFFSSMYFSPRRGLPMILNFCMPF